MKHAKTALIRLFNYAKAYRKDIYLGAIYSFLNKLFDVLPEILIGVAVDIVVKRQDSLLGKLGFTNLLEQLLILGALTFVIWGCESLFEYLYALKWRNLAQALQHQLRLDAYEHLQKTDMQHFERQHTGNLVAILNDDINQLERFLSNGANTIIQILSSSVLIGIVFFILSWKIALLALTPIPLIILGSYYFQRLVTPRYAQVRTQAGNLSTRFNNNLLGMTTIRSYTAEAYELASLEQQSRAYQDANREAIKLGAAINPIIRIAILLGFMATLLYGGWQALEGILSVGAYSALVFLTQRLLWPLTNLAEITDQYFRAMACADRVLQLLEIPQSKIAPVPYHPIIKGELSLQNVHFAYHANKPILQQLNLHIHAGTTIALVGMTGSGKSTIAKLLLRFYDPSAGQILLDGKNLMDYDLTHLRQQIGYVSQDVFLFEGTVAENIAYGSFNADRSAIEQAAKMAAADEFIEHLPQGYDTPVGERGQRLSGGQRQRLGLARAILKNPPILVLDEATSAVDNETEAAIQRSLAQIVKNRTTILIAHRLSTVRHADCIYVLHHGEMIEQGTHEELIDKKGNYSTLWALQTGTVQTNDHQLEELIN